MSDVINDVPRELLEFIAANARGVERERIGELRALLTAQPQASVDDSRKLSDLGNELHNLSCEVVHSNEDWAEQIGKIACELWKWPQASAAQSAPVVPDGWRLVPVEPTPAMLRAGVHQAVGALPIYRAMLAACKGPDHG